MMSVQELGGMLTLRSWEPIKATVNNLLRDHNWAITAKSATAWWERSEAALWRLMVEWVRKPAREACQ